MSLHRPRRLGAALVAATTTLAVAGGLAPAPAAAAPTFDQFCSGMTAPARSEVGNQAPAPVADTAKVIAGSSVTIPVLANDSDPDGDRLHVVSVSQPSRGQTCVHGDGSVELFAGGSRNDYTATFSYGVTDGERYRTAQVRVQVEGVALVRGKVTKKLRTQGTRVTRPAQVAFRNTNDHPVYLLAGRPRADRPTVERKIRPGATLKIRTRLPRMVYVAVLAPRGAEPVLVNIGQLNTRTGRGRTVAFDDGLLLRETPAGARTAQDFWSAAQ